MFTLSLSVNGENIYQTLGLPWCSLSDHVTAPARILFLHTGCGEILLINSKHQNIFINMTLPACQHSPQDYWQIGVASEVRLAYLCVFIALIVLPLRPGLIHHCRNRSLPSVSPERKAAMSKPKISLRNESFERCLGYLAAGLSSRYCLHLVLLAFKMISSETIFFSVLSLSLLSPTHWLV